MALDVRLLLAPLLCSSLAYGSSNATVDGCSNRCVLDSESALSCYTDTLHYYNK